MADTFHLRGSLTVEPPRDYDAAQPGYGALAVVLKKDIALEKEQVTVVDLSADAPKAVSLGDLSGANVVYVSVLTGKLTATLTSADGAAQAVPVEDTLLVISASKPFTAVSLTRAAGTLTRAQVFLGQKTTT